jgi:hypothetical protein
MLNARGITDKLIFSSLPQEDIPAKLRCAICSKLAVNAFRLPCCEQAICESCQSTLPASCPVCEHSPLSADDCKPHKALRTTIKVFLRTEEKKRESSRAKDVATTPITPVEPSPIAATAPAIPESAPTAEGTEAVEQQQSAAEGAGGDADASAEVQEDEGAVREQEGYGGVEKTEDDAVGHPTTFSIVTIRANKNQEQPPQNAAEGEPGEKTTTDLVPISHETEVAEAGNAEEAKEEAENGDENEENLEGSGVVQPDAMSGAFPTTGFAPGFDQMQMMMAMQNGFGSFPMMGQFHFSCVLFQGQRLTLRRHAGHEHGPDDDADVHEWRLSRHGHERHEHEYGHGRLRRRSR